MFGPEAIHAIKDAKEPLYKNINASAPPISDLAIADIDDDHDKAEKPKHVTEWGEYGW